MHVAYLVTSPGIPVGGPSGASVHVAGVVRALVRAGHRVSLLAAGYVEGPDEPLPAHLGLAPPLRCPQYLRLWHRLKPPVPRAALETWQAEAFAARVLPWLQQDPPDLLLERYALFSHAGQRLRSQLNIPLVLEVNAPLRLERARFEGLSLRHPKAEETLREYERRILGGADQLLVVSSVLGRYVEQEVGIAGGRVRVVPNGVSPEGVSPEGVSPNGVSLEGVSAERPSGTSEAPRVAFLGSLKPWHGVDAWGRVFALARAQVPNLQGVVIGDGPGRASLDATLQATGARAAVTFTGRLGHAEALRVLEGCTLLLAPYPRFEPFYFCPLKVVEALGRGVPVISSAQGMLPDLVGTGGRLLAPEDEAGMASAIVEAVRVPEVLERYRRGARAAGAVLTWDPMIQALQEARTAFARRDT